MANLAVPLAALFVAMGSIAIASMGARRQGRRDYTIDQATRIDELEKQVENMRAELAAVRAENADLKRDNRKLRDDNERLMWRLLRLENGAT